MKKYYEDNSVTIYHADCRDIIPHIDVQNVMTDPPYGIDGGRGGGSRARGKGDYASSFEDTRETIRDIVIPAIFSVECDGMIVTPGFRNLDLYPQADSFGCFYQPASCGFQRWGNCDSQPILYYGKSYLQGKKPMPCSFVLTESPEKNGHPCVKPIKMWSRLMEKLPKEGVILDPFMGSGTTLRAAKDSGRKAIGIELEEEYCEIAATRMAQECFSFV